MRFNTCIFADGTDTDRAPLCWKAIVCVCVCACLSVSACVSVSSRWRHVPFWIANFSRRLSAPPPPPPPSGGGGSSSSLVA